MRLQIFQKWPLPPVSRTSCSPGFQNFRILEFFFLELIEHCTALFSLNSGSNLCLADRGTEGIPDQLIAHLSVVSPESSAYITCTVRGDNEKSYRCRSAWAPLIPPLQDDSKDFTSSCFLWSPANLKSSCRTMEKRDEVKNPDNKRL